MISLVSLLTAMNYRDQALNNMLEAQEGFFNLMGQAPRFASQGSAGMHEAAALDTKLQSSLLMNRLRYLFCAEWAKSAEKMASREAKERFSAFM